MTPIGNRDFRKELKAVGRDQSTQIPKLLARIDELETRVNELEKLVHDCVRSQQPKALPAPKRSKRAIGAIDD